MVATDGVKFSDVTAPYVHQLNMESLRSLQPSTWMITHKVAEKTALKGGGGTVHKAHFRLQCSRYK